MLPLLILLLAPAALGEHSSLDDTAAYIQQHLKPARPTRWGAVIAKEGACLAIVFDLHDLKRPSEATPGGVPPFEMSMSWSTDVCQSLAAPPQYKMRSGTFFAHWGCRLDVYEGDSCNGRRQNVAFGTSLPSPGFSQFTSKKRLHPGDDEERFYKSARCRCSQIAGLNMREAAVLEGDGEVLEEGREVSDDEERSEAAEGGLQEVDEGANSSSLGLSSLEKELEGVEEDRSVDFEEEAIIVNSSSPEAQFEEVESIVNSSALGDFRSSNGCRFHSNNGGQFSGADFFYHFNIRRPRSPSWKAAAQKPLPRALPRVRPAAELLLHHG